jgi:pyruvate carboxylase subunit B
MVDSPLKITDVTLRDGNQSLIATRMRLEDMVDIAPEMDKVGFFAMEVWGGATFDVTIRFLNEDPWERLRVLKRLLPHTRLQMLLRGQSLVGYRQYADDVVIAFIKHAAQCGIDIFSIFDACNDERNIQTAFRAAKETGKLIEGVLCYALTESKLGGEIFNINYYVNKALTLQEMGADIILIDDMSGILAPYDAYDLVKAIKPALKIPVEMHCHYTGGMACMCYIKAIEAGIDILDTDFAPFALRTAHPPLESIVMTLQGTPRDTGFNLAQLVKIDDYLETVISKYHDFLDTTKTSIINPEVVRHQLPGGMFTNLVAQLKEINSLDRLPEIYAELPRVRKELGFPPLATPTSQIVGVQAVQNVLSGRYKMISRQVKDYVYGLYGKPPGPIDPEIQKIVLNHYERGNTPITCRPADLLAPELDKAREATQGIARDIGDVLTYALYPATGMEFLKKKYGLPGSSAEVKK